MGTGSPSLLSYQNPFPSPGGPAPVLPFINAKLYGAAGNGKSRSDGVAAATNPSFTSPTANFSSADTGKLIFIQGAGVGGADLATTITVVNATTVTLTVAPSTSVNPATFYWGTDDTPFLQAAINGTLQGLHTLQPAGGVISGAPSCLAIPGAVYMLTGELTFTGIPYADLIGFGTPILVQTNSTQRIFVFPNGYTISIKNMKFVGGKYAIDYRNANLDAAALAIEDCEFQQQNNYCIWTSASVSRTQAGIPYVTGTISSNGTNTWTGSGTAWSDANHAFYDLHTTDGSDQWYKIAEVVSGTSLVTSRPAAGNLSGVTYEIIDSHLSAQVSITRCRFYNVNKVIFANTEHTIIRDSWVTVYGVTNSTPLGKFSANSAAFRLFYGNLIMSNMLGVAGMGTAGVDLIASPRWIDMDAGNLYVSERARFGNDLGGMAIVWYYVPYKNTAPYQGGGQGTSGKIVIRDSFTSGGQAGAPAGDPGLVVLKPNGRAATGRENVPIELVYKNCEYLSGVPILNNNASLDINTFIGTGLANTNIERKFRYDIGPNSTTIDTIGLSGSWNGSQSSIGFLRFCGEYTITGSLNFGTVNHLSGVSQTLNVPGVQDGDIVIPMPVASFGNAADFLDRRAIVTTPDTGLVTGVVTVRLSNATAATDVNTGGASNWTIYVRKLKWLTDTP